MLKFAVYFMIIALFTYSEFANNADINKEENLEFYWKCFRKIFKEIRSWISDLFIKLKIKPKDLILYPFGGADIAFPLAFFQDFKTLVIIGLEPIIGIGKNCNEISDGVVQNMRFFLKYGYFVTRDMETFYKNGILTVMILQLKELGAENISYVITNKKIEINCVLEGTERKIIYLQLNLNDSNYSQWHLILKEYQEYTLFIKSASYVLQQTGFNKIRDHLFNGSNIIVQDDTGFSYKYLLNHNCVIYLYGGYEKALAKGVERYSQADLAEAYKESEILPFNIGYNVRCGSCGNLMIIKNEK